MSMSIIWLIVTVLAGIFEAITVGLVSIWFAFGGFAALIADRLNVPVSYQLIIFIVVSALTMLIIKPIAEKNIKAGHQATNADSLVGKEGIVTEEIDNISNKGEIKIGGLKWSAKSLNSEVIPIKAIVEVKDIVGVKLIVEKKNK